MAPPAAVLSIGSRRRGWCLDPSFCPICRDFQAPGRLPGWLGELEGTAVLHPSFLETGRCSGLSGQCLLDPDHHRLPERPDIQAIVQETPPQHDPCWQEEEVEIRDLATYDLLEDVEVE